MPLMAASGTSVDRIRPESVKNSTAPERTWPSTSVSAPSWLLGNSPISSAPFDSALMRSKAPWSRTFNGWLAGTLVANL